MTERDLPEALGRVRALTTRYLSGTPDAFDGARELLEYLLRVTVMRQQGLLRFSTVEGGRPNARALGVRHQPIPLNDGRYLRLLQSLRLDEVPSAQSKLRVYAAGYQYQMDLDGDQWIFRYDYIREPEDRHPSPICKSAGV